MTETLTAYAASAYETEAETYENETYVAESSSSSTEEEPWGTDLMNYVMANRHVMVRCPWMGGVVTLGEAMMTYTYPPNMTEKDVPAVMAVVNELLANSVEEKEEPEKEDTREDQTEKKVEDNEPKEQPARTQEPVKKTKTETETRKEKVETTVKTEKLGNTATPTGRIKKPNS